MLDMSANGRDILNVNCDGLPDSLRKFMLEHFAETHEPPLQSSDNRLTSSDSQTIVSKSENSEIVAVLEVMLKAGYPHEQIKDILSVLVKKSSDTSDKSSDNRLTSVPDPVARKRARDVEYQRKRRLKAKKTSDVSDDAGSNEHISSSSLLPLEEYKEKKEETGDTRARAHALPDDWAPTPKHFELAQSLGHSQQDVVTFAADMRDWAKANAGRSVSKKTDWNAAFNNWIRRQRRPTNVRSGSGISDPHRQGGGRVNGIQDALGKLRENFGGNAGGGRETRDATPRLLPDGRRK